MLIEPPSRSKRQKVQPLQAGKALRQGADLVDRADDVAERNGAVGAHHRLPAALFVEQNRSRRDHARLDQAGEGDARLLPFAERRLKAASGKGSTAAIRVVAPRRYRFRSRSQPMKWRPSFLATAPVVPVPKKGSSTTSPGFDAAMTMRASRASGFWVGWVLRAVLVLQALSAGADRKKPVGAHLAVFVASLQRLVIEGIGLRARAFRGPDHGLVGIGEPPAAEIRHRIGLAPDDVVENPEAEILQDRADAENIVIGADDEDRRLRLHRAPRGREPVAGEAVVIGERGEFVPVVVDRVDFALVGPGQAAFELKIIGRIGEDQIDAGLGQAAHGLDAIADEDPVERRRQTAGSGRRGFRASGRRPA